MSMQYISVAVVGEGRLAEGVAQRVGARADLRLAALIPVTGEPPAEASCVVYLPTCAELEAGEAAARIIAFLRAGYNVVSTVPALALRGVDMLGACREGQSSYHGSGGFQSALITRFNRAFASITRNIREVELIEELDIEETPAHPWRSPADAGFDNGALERVAGGATLAAGSATLVERYYEAGLRTLSEAVFGSDNTFAEKSEDAGVEVSAARVRQNEGPRRSKAKAQEALEQIVVRRSLGEHVVYDSVWTKRQDGRVPLRYRLNTTSADAVGHVTISFHADTTAVRPADHLACVGLLDAIRPVVASAPGILHHDLEINCVKTDDRLAR